MSRSLYFILLIVFVLIGVAFVLLARYKRNSHTELYKEGVHHENEGEYSKALQNFEDALAEIRKLKVDNKFGDKIEGRIKLLRTVIDYEKNVNISRPV